MNPLSITEVMDEVFGRWFEGESWHPWRAALKAIFAEPLPPAELETFITATGRVTPPSQAVTEAWLCIGRRGGKSLVAALIVVFLAFFKDYSPYLAPGERATVMLIAADRKQARVVLRYIMAFITETPMLYALVSRQTQEVVELSNRVNIEVHVASFKTVRGYTFAAVVNDELAFWPTDENSAQPDSAIISAQRPALATIPGSLMLNISSPYARRGAMWTAYQTHYGRDDSPVLYWQAASRSLAEDDSLVEMNPTIDRRLVEQAYETDPIAAASEWGAEFRSDLEQLFTLEMLDRVTDYDRPEILPPCFSEV